MTNDRHTGPRAAPHRLAARRAALAALAAACCGGPHEDPARARPQPSAAPCPAEPALDPPPPTRHDLPYTTGPEEQADPRPPAAPASPYTALDPAEVRQRLWAQPRLLAYVPPSPQRAAALAALIRRMLADPPPEPEDLGDMAFAAGYEVQAWQVAGQRLLAAVEPPGRLTGGGAFVVRADPDPGPPVILQAPHAFHDLGTEAIALSLLVHGRAWPRALFVNTVHRYLDIDGARRERDEAPADPCHNEAHLFAVATAAALDALPGAEIVQLHGFGDADPFAPDVVVSAGDRAAPTPRSAQVADRLRDALEVDVALFPVDQTRLGATSNVQGRLVRARGGQARFVHVELSLPLRRRLQRDPQALARLADALRPGPARPDISQRALD